MNNADIALQSYALAKIYSEQLWNNVKVASNNLKPFAETGW